MNIKQPPCYDISHYETVNNFSAINPRPLLMITKATEGASIIDGKFAPYFDGMKSAAIARGCYHFFRKASNIAAQANLFIRVVESRVNVNDFLILDVEEGGETAGQLKAWLDIVSAKFPDNIFMIYSRANILDAISMTQAQKDYFQLIPVWTAGYPVNPDFYSTIPPMYIPDQTKWGEALLWQYTEDGIVDGIGGKTDLNYMTPKMISMVEDLEPPPPVNTDVHTNTHKGIDVYKLTRFGTTVWVHVIDPKVARIQISSCGYRTPLYAMGLYNADMVTNFGGWPDIQTATQRSNEIWASQGEIIQATALDDRPYINVSSDGTITVSPNDKLLPDIYNAGGFDRLLLWGGVFNSAITELRVKDARTGSGVTADNKFVLLNAEGNDLNNVGLTFPEMASVMLEFGVRDGGNNDGGSSTCVRNNAISDDPLFPGSDGKEAAVINHLLVFGGNENIPPTEEVMPTVKAVQKLNTTPTNIKPMDGSPSYAIAQLQPGWWVYGDRSETGTDIINVIAYYKGSDAAEVMLSEKCKLSVTNLTVTTYTPPVEPPPVEPPPIATGDVEVIVSIVNDVTTVKVNGELYGKQ